MQFTAAAEKYDRFMGRYATSLAPNFADAAGIEPGMRVLDVGCGPGALTHEVVARVGAENVAAIDPAPQFAAANGERHPGIDVRVGVAEELPWDDGTFDAALCSLVVAFMRDPDHGLREMARVTRPGGTVGACMWDVPGGGMTMLATFWAAARAVDPDVIGERLRPGVAEGDLAARFERAGLEDVRHGSIEASTEYDGFDDFWEPFTYAVGPTGEYLASLDAERAGRVRDAARASLPHGPFTLTARAWVACGTKPA